MSHDISQERRFHRRYLQVPGRWTDDHVNLLRFSFPPEPTPAPLSMAIPGSLSEDLAWKLRLDLTARQWLSRHAAITRLFNHDTPPSDWRPRNERIALRFKRRQLFFDCVIAPQRDQSGREVRFIAYSDEGQVRFQRQRARKLTQRAGMKLDDNNPYITALLVAVAQAHDNRRPYVPSYVLFTPNPIGEPSLSLKEIRLYTARVPRVLLDFFKRPRATLPAYDPISVSCVSIPVEPLGSLRERIFLAMGQGC